MMPVLHAGAAPAPLPNALLILLAMSAAAIVHLSWLKSAPSRRFAAPIDAGLAWRGRRLLGDNKQVRGLMALPAGAALTFALLPHLRPVLPAWLADGLWNMPSVSYALLGLCCGLAFMVAELPNSFLKRRLGVAPGQAPRGPALRAACTVLDRLDSVLGVVAACLLLVPMAWATALWLLAAGPLVHAGFSVLQFTLGLKSRRL